MTTRRTEVAVIGGGLMGVWTAFFLCRRGYAVTILEKDVVGAQASGVNYGNLRLQGRHPGQLPLALRAHAHWERLESLIGESCEFTRSGHLYAAVDQEQRRKAQQYAMEGRAHGVDIEILDGLEISHRWPWLAPNVIGGSFSRRDAVANPRLAGPAVARAAKALGAEVLERVRVIAAEGEKGRFRLRTEEGAAIESEILVNAAGAWANDIAAAFGERAPMIPAGPPQFVTEPLPLFIEPSVQLVDGSVIFRQVQRGNVVVSGYPRGPADPATLRAPVPPGKTLATMRRLAEVAPVLAGAHVIRVWSGIEGYVADMLPVIGPSASTPGLFHAFGFCGHGFQLSPGVGDALAERIATGATSTPLDLFSIRRFESGHATDARFASEFDPALAAAGQAG
jgi:sarcosine oxidase, subunit beta